MAVIGFPLLMAMIFAAAWKLSPFAERQGTYDRLRAAGIRCHIRDGDKVGEWIQDRQGNTLPTWVATRIGPDSMKELFSISGDLQDLQNFNYRDIDGSTIRYVSIDRYGYGGDVAVSQDFADWLDGLPLLSGMSVSLTFQYGDDQAAIVQSSVQLVSDALGRNAQGRVHAGSHFRIQAPTLAPETIRSLSDLPPGINLGLGGTTLDSPLLKSLAVQNLGMLSLTNVSFPDLASVSASDAPAVREVHVYGTFVSLDQLRHLVRIFQCETVSVEIGNASEEQIRECWSSMANENLQTLKVYRRSGEPLRFSRRR